MVAAKNKAAVQLSKVSALRQSIAAEQRQISKLETEQEASAAAAAAAAAATAATATATATGVDDGTSRTAELTRQSEKTAGVVDMTDEELADAVLDEEAR